MAATALNPETSLNIWISTNKMDFSESLLLLFSVMQLLLEWNVMGT